MPHALPRISATCIGAVGFIAIYIYLSLVFTYDGHLLTRSVQRLFWHRPKLDLSLLFPPPAFGSYEVLGVGQDDCRTYGARYSEVYDTSGKTTSLQDESPHRLAASAYAKPDVTGEAVNDAYDRHSNERGASVDAHQTAIVFRAWDTFQWTADDERNVRAMVTEMESFGQGAFDVHILLHVKTAPEASLPSSEIPHATKAHWVPAEFINITEVWTYGDCEAAYPAVGEYEWVYVSPKLRSWLTTSQCLLPYLHVTAALRGETFRI